MKENKPITLDTLITACDSNKRCLCIINKVSKEELVQQLIIQKIKNAKIDCARTVKLFIPQDWNKIIKIIEQISNWRLIIAEYRRIENFKRIIAMRKFDCVFTDIELNEEVAKLIKGETFIHSKMKGVKRALSHLIKE